MLQRMHVPVVAVAPPRSPRRATIEEWLAIPEERRAELVDGRILYQGMPGPVHGRTQSKGSALISGPYDRRPGGAGGPGGWWISVEVDMDLAGMGCRPDILGWRRDKHPALPVPDRRGVVTDVPDWICEVLSPGTMRVDLGAKRVGYHRAGVTHYWLADPQNKTLTVLSWTKDGYLVELVAGPGDKVRAAPFDAVEIDVAELFGDEEAEEPPPPAEEPPIGP
jgi:Uma2 family endonuclease